VPNEYNKGAQILFVGESPGEEEEFKGRPFVGTAGQKLEQVLNVQGLSRTDVSFANLSQYRPYDNRFELLINTQQLYEGTNELYEFIRNCRPNVIVPLGRWPLFYLTGRIGITKHRGSILSCSIQGCEDIKTIPTFHPSYISRDPSNYPVFNRDIARIVSDATCKEFRLPTRRYIINPRGLELEDWTEKLCNSEWLGCDIESVKNTTHIICIGFAPSPDVAVVLPFEHYNRSNIERICESKAKKIFHFGIFDTLMLLENGIIVNNYEWDTLTAQHALEPELPRSLEFLTSIYTREPYYKTHGRSELPSDVKAWGKKSDRRNIYEYNGKDCCVTHEIKLAQERELTEDRNAMHVFQFEMSEIEMAQEMSRTGLLVFEERRQLLEKAMLRKWAKLQFILDNLVGDGNRVNVNSPPQMCKLLYETLKLPPKRDRGSGKLTADEAAIVKLIGYCKDHLSKLTRESAIKEWEYKLQICRCILFIRGIRTNLSRYIRAKISVDGRIRSTVKVSNTETGRYSMQKYIDGTGVNAQTFSRGVVEIEEDMTNQIDISALIVQMKVDDIEEEEDDEKLESITGEEAA
jgi:DNA polymerase